MDLSHTRADKHIPPKHPHIKNTLLDTNQAYQQARRLQQAQLQLGLPITSHAASTGNLAAGHAGSLQECYHAEKLWLRTSQAAAPQHKQACHPVVEPSAVHYTSCTAATACHQLSTSAPSTDNVTNTTNATSAPGRPMLRLWTHPRTPDLCESAACPAAAAQQFTQRVTSGANPRHTRSQ